MPFFNPFLEGKFLKNKSFDVSFISESFHFFFFFLSFVLVSTKVLEIRNEGI